MSLRYILNAIHGGTAEVNHCTYLLLDMAVGISSGTEKGLIRCYVCMNKITEFLAS